MKTTDAIIGRFALAAIFWAFGHYVGASDQQIRQDTIYLEAENACGGQAWISSRETERKGKKIREELCAGGSDRLLKR